MVFDMLGLPQRIHYACEPQPTHTVVNPQNQAIVIHRYVDGYSPHDILDAVCGRPYSKKNRIRDEEAQCDTVDASFFIHLRHNTSELSCLEVFDRTSRTALQGAALGGALGTAVGYTLKAAALGPYALTGALLGAAGAGSAQYRLLRRAQRFDAAVTDLAALAGRIRIGKMDFAPLHKEADRIAKQGRGCGDEDDDLGPAFARLMDGMYFMLKTEEAFRKKHGEGAQSPALASFYRTICVWRHV